MVSRRHRHELRERDHNLIASDKLPPAFHFDAVPLSLPSLTVTPRVDVRTLDDRRLFHPADFFRPAASVFKEDARVVARHKSRSVALSGQYFNVPERVAVCVRRKARREVMFAKRFTGRASRKKHFNFWSSVRC